MVDIAFNPFASLKGKGLKNRLIHPYDALWDLRLGVNTFGYSPAVGEMTDDDWQCHYVPASYRDIFAIFRRLKLSADDIFVDLGCGMGRAVFAAKWLGVKRAIGVEIDRRLIPPRGEFICAPAETYQHKDTTAIFMFNPFGIGTMRTVIENLDFELDRKPRALRLAYLNPIFDGAIEASRHLKLTHRLSGKYDTSFYETGVLK